jgi:hypothetical protein
LHLQKYNLHLGRFYLLNVILHVLGPSTFQRDLPKCKLHFWRYWFHVFFGGECKLHFWRFYLPQM